MAEIIACFLGILTYHVLRTHLDALSDLSGGGGQVMRPTIGDAAATIPTREGG